MMSFTVDQWIVIGLVLLLGIVIGALSRSGGARYKRELQIEREQHQAYERKQEARITAANKRIAELERYTPAMGAGTAASIGAAARGRHDDLSLIRGVGRSGETRLNELGIHSYRDIEKMTPEDEAALEGRMGAEPGFIEREHWREQARLLRKGDMDEHARRFGAV